MSGLNASLSIATQSLMAQEAEISVANNNIANVDTPGYSRETVLLTESSPTQVGANSLGNGVTLQGFSSVRDEVLNLRIQQQGSQQSSADAQTNALNQVQSLFPSTGASLGSDLSSFFASISALSSAPTSAAVRQTVLSTGQDLASQFNTVSAGLTSEQSGLDQQVSTDVAGINKLSAQIATLNGQLAEGSARGQDDGTVKDQIGALETQLSQLTNISVIHTQEGDTLTTGNGTLLVGGDQSYALRTTQVNGHADVLDTNGSNITSTISGGDLGGAIKVRDTGIPALLTQLDTFASQLATSVNTAQAAGFDQNGNQGAPLFTVSSGVAGSAATIAIATSDPAAIAASSSSAASGSNGNVANLAALQTTVPAAGTSLTGRAAALVYEVGSLTATATAQSNAIGISLSQLRQQQSSVSGVSIDEESANLIRYQQAYEAAAKIVSTIQTLFDATINMVGG